MRKPATAFALEHAAWPAFLVDPTGAIIQSSTGAKTTFGSSIETRPDLAGPIWSRENEFSPEQLLKNWRDTGKAPTELRLRGRDGSTWSYSPQICPAGGEDDPHLILQLFKLTSQEPPAATVHPPTTKAATETRSGSDSTVMEASVAQKQKLDCAMQLIRTVALDFNNALTSIMGHASLLLGRLESKSPLRNSLVEIEKSAQRAAEIAHDLADFSRQEKDTRAQQAGNVNDVVRRTVEFFRQAQPETLHFKLQFEPRPYTVNFDEAKIQQAIVKVLENAAQAMDGFGTIHVITRNLDLSEPMKDGTARLPAGSFFCLEIMDMGAGIPHNLLPRIFEPFFTTKKDSGHRGLGLAWVYGIVTNHGGSVAVSSEVGKGTAVRIYLPAQRKVVIDTLADSRDLTGSQTILMIDDEDLLLTMGEMVLSSFGYRVLTANSGQKALQIFQEKSSEIDLVITDLVMPQMSGRELIERLRKLSPGVKVICASGFVRPPSSDEDENYLQKPFASQDLLRKVKQVLGG